MMNRALVSTYIHSIIPTNHIRFVIKLGLDQVVRYLFFFKQGITFDSRKSSFSNLTIGYRISSTKERLVIGRTVSHFKILEKLGSGGMGDVYRATDLELQRDVAIKVLREELAADPERLRRFEQEARSASALNHPNIITIYEIGKVDSTPYIAMELVDGVTLREMLSEGPLAAKKMVPLATQIAEGLAKAHAAGIVHRDLKPENIMITRDGFVKILDFGLAKLVTPELGADSEVATMAKGDTSPGVVMGTAGYMSPEQAKGQPADFRADQFAFGVILYEMATGKRAFQGDTPMETLSAIIQRETRPQDGSSCKPAGDGGALPGQSAGRALRVHA